MSSKKDILGTLAAAAGILIGFTGVGLAGCAFFAFIMAVGATFWACVTYAVVNWFLPVLNVTSVGPWSFWPQCYAAAAIVMVIIMILKRRGGRSDG